MAKTEENRPCWRPSLLAAAASSLFAVSCYTPQIVRESEHLGIHLDQFPPGTESVAVPVSKSTNMHGVFVPSDANSPLVLHFLESGCSITQGSISFPSLEAIWDLRDRGFSSLVIDYRGIGSSDGDRSTDNLSEDARLIWEEALRRVGGDPRRIILRGMSIGTLASSSVLGSGAQPAGAILISPVRGETVAIHYVARKVPANLAELMGFLFNRATEIDLTLNVSKSEAPILVIGGENDELLSDTERRFLRYAVRSIRGRFVLREGEDHFDTVLEAHRLLPEERNFYRELYPMLPPVEERVERVLAGLDATDLKKLQGDTDQTSRLSKTVSRWYIDQPELAVAMALAPSEPLERDQQRIAWLRRLPSERLKALPVDALCALVDMTDEAGLLDLSELVPMERLVSEWRVLQGNELTPEKIISLALGLDLQDEARFRPHQEQDSSYVDLFEGEVLMRRVDLPATPVEDSAPRLRLSRAGSFRQAVRLLLKAAGLPERAGPMVDGRSKIDVYYREKWSSHALPNLPPAESEASEPSAEESVDLSASGVQ